MEALFAQLAAVARRQHALLTLVQLRELGVGRHRLQRLLAGGQLVRVAPRVFLINGAVYSWPVHLHAECLSAGPDTVVSHRPAAALYQLDGFDPLRTVHLTVPPDRSPRRRRDVRIHASVDFDLIHPATRQGIPVTDPARTVLGLCAAEPNRDVARRGLFSAPKKKLVTWGDLHTCLEAHARPGRRGIRVFRSDLELYSRIGCPETTFEDRIREVLVGGGLPEPRLQHWVSAGGRRYRIDAAYPGLKVGIEGRSKAHHFTDEAFERDPVRDAHLAIAGWIVIHVTWAQLDDDPAGVVRLVERALSRRAGAAA